MRHGLAETGRDVPPRATGLALVGRGTGRATTKRPPPSPLVARVFGLVVAGLVAAGLLEVRPRGAPLGGLGAVAALVEAEEDVSLTLDSLLVLSSLAGPPSSDRLSSDRLRPLFPPVPGVSFSGSRTRFLPTARRLFFCLVAGISFFSSSVKVMLVTSGPMNWNAGFLPLPSVT